MIDLTVVVDNTRDYNRVMNCELNVEPYLTILDEQYNDDKKKAWQIKSEWGAKENPFIVINKDFKHYKTIYKEGCEDPIQEMINVLNDF